MTATFPKNRTADRVVTYRWPDGLVATTPLGGRPESLPHDLSHYIVEAAFRPPYGFWALVERQAPFASLTPVKGRWPKGKVEWFARVIRKHQPAMLKAEATGLRALFAAADDDAVDRIIPELVRQLRRAYALAPDSGFENPTREQFHTARALRISINRAWERVPMGGALEVRYPPAPAPRIHQRLAAAADA